MATWPCLETGLVITPRGQEGQPQIGICDGQMCRTVPTTKNPSASNVSSAKTEKRTRKSKRPISSFKAGCGLASTYLSELLTAPRPLGPPRAVLRVPASPLSPPRAVINTMAPCVTDTSLKTLLLTLCLEKVHPPRYHHDLEPRAPEAPSQI